MSKADIIVLAALTFMGGVGSGAILGAWAAGMRWRRSR